jgi:hypothetical protein
MPNDVAIKVKNFSKLYKIGARQAGYKTFRIQLPFAMTEEEDRSGGAD